MLVIGLRRRIGWMRFSNSEIEDWAYKATYGRHKSFSYISYHLDNHLDKSIAHQTDEFLNYIKR